MDYEKTQHALYNELELGSATLLQLAFLGESNLKFPLGQQQQSVQRGGREGGGGGNAVQTLQVLWSRLGLNMERNWF